MRKLLFSEKWENAENIIFLQFYGNSCKNAKIKQTSRFDSKFCTGSKVTGSLFVCLCVPKGLPKCSADTVLLYSVALIGPGQVYDYLWEGYHFLQRDIVKNKKNIKIKVGLSK